MKECESSESRISTKILTEINDGDIFDVDESILLNKANIRIDRCFWINDGRKNPHKNPTLSKSFFKVKSDGKSS